MGQKTEDEQQDACCVQRRLLGSQRKRAGSCFSISQWAASAFPLGSQPSSGKDLVQESSKSCEAKALQKMESELPADVYLPGKGPQGTQAVQPGSWGSSLKLVGKSPASLRLPFPTFLASVPPWGLQWGEWGCPLGLSSLPPQGRWSPCRCLAVQCKRPSCVFWV